MNGLNLSQASNICLGATSVSAVYLGNTLIWSNEHDYSQDYLTFEMLDAIGTLTFSDTVQQQSVQYSTNNGTTWETLTNGSNTPVLSQGQKILLKGNLTNSGSNGVGGLTTISHVNVSGNIMSLIYGDNFQNQTTIPSTYLFARLFMTSNIVSAENLVLPATTLTDYCYYYMFQQCTALTAAPALLPAPYIAVRSYSYMFQGCSSLINAPVISATTMGGYSCANMFQECTALTTAPDLNMATLNYGDFENMFSGCSSLTYVKCLATTVSRNSTSGWMNYVPATGTFVKHPNATTSFGGTWVRNANGIPAGWTVENAQL